MSTNFLLQQSLYWCWDVSQDNWSLWPTGGARGKVGGWPKWLGFIVWAPWMSVPNVVAVYLVVYEIIQSEPKWTNHQTNIVIYIEPITVFGLGLGLMLPYVCWARDKRKLQLNCVTVGNISLLKMLAKQHNTEEVRKVSRVASCLARCDCFVFKELELWYMTSMKDHGFPSFHRSIPVFFSQF